MTSKTCKILNWNADGLNKTVGELIWFLNQYKIDIAIITETKLVPNNKIKVRNYNIIRKDRNNNGGGVAILIKQNINFVELNSVNCVIENIPIKLANGVIIVGCYAPPNVRLSNATLDTLLGQGNRTLLIGDFNCRHTTWNNFTSNRNGRLLYNYINDGNVQLLCPGTHTHFPYNGTRSSCIDFVLNKNVNNFPEPYVLEELSSDHLPVICEWHTGKLEESKQTTKIYKNVDWRRFRTTLNEATTINNNIQSIASLESEVQQITENIQTAGDEIAQKVILKPQEDRLPAEILNLIKFRNKIRKRYQRYRQRNEARRLVALTHAIREKIYAHKNRAWKGVLQGLSTDDKSLWKLTKRLRKQFVKIPSFLNNDVQTNKQKADTLAVHLAEICTPDPNITQEQVNIQTTAEALMAQKYPIPPTVLPRILVKPKELRKIIQNLPNNKAPGEDSIPNILLKNLPRKTFIQLSYITNAIIQLQHFPAKWKNAVVIPILKPSKNPKNPDSYRPISLLNSMSKVVEKAISNKISSLDLLQRIPKEQFGFRADHSTTLAVARVVQTSLNKINQGQNTILLSLDIKRAFDKVWLKGLIYKLYTYHNFPLFLISLISSYISERTLQVRVESSLSDRKTLKAGVPQGTVLSPGLFNLYLADIPEYCQTGISTYADDTLIFAHSHHAEVAKRHIEGHLRSLIPYFSQWKLQINAEKTELVILTKRFTMNKIIIPLKINDTIIKPQKHIKYLGVTIDARLRFGLHVSQALKKTFIAMQKLYSLLSPRSTLSPTNKRLIYIQIIRPIMTYAAPVWCSMSRAQFNRMQRIQNKFLRCITSSDRYTRIDDLHQMANIERIDAYVAEISEKFFREKVHASPLTRDLTSIRHDANPTHKPIYANLPLYFEE